MKGDDEQTSEMGTKNKPETKIKLNKVCITVSHIKTIKLKMYLSHSNIDL